MIEKIKKIKMLILDVDGVLTDSMVILGNAEGEEYKTFNEKDAAGLRMLKRADILPGIITGRESKVVQNYARQVGIEDLYQKVFVKVEALEKIMEKRKLSPDEIAYVGDDLIDIGILKRVGFAVAVNNAVKEAKDEADYITEQNGGSGAVREVVELILKTQNKWDQVTERYYK